MGDLLEPEDADPEAVGKNRQRFKKNVNLRKVNESTGN